MSPILSALVQSRIRAADITAWVSFTHDAEIPLKNTKPKWCILLSRSGRDTKVCSGSLFEVQFHCMHLPFYKGSSGTYFSKIECSSKASGSFCSHSLWLFTSYQSSENTEKTTGNVAECCAVTIPLMSHFTARNTTVMKSDDSFFFSSSNGAGNHWGIFDISADTAANSQCYSLI